jgi:hypothetical protein
MAPVTAKDPASERNNALLPLDWKSMRDLEEGDLQSEFGPPPLTFSGETGGPNNSNLRLRTSLFLPVAGASLTLRPPQVASCHIGLFWQSRRNRPAYERSRSYTVNVIIGPGAPGGHAYHGFLTASLRSSKFPKLLRACLKL